MKAWTVLFGMTLLTAMVIGVATRDYDVFLWCLGVMAVVIFSLYSLREFLRQREVHKLQKRYKPYELKLLGEVAQTLEHRKLIQIDRKHVNEKERLLHSDSRYQ